MGISEGDSGVRTQDEQLTAIYLAITQNSGKTNENMSTLFKQVDSLVALVETIEKRLCTVERKNELLEREIENLKSMGYFSSRSTQMKVSGIPSSCSIPLRDIANSILKRMNLEFLCNNILEVRTLIEKNDPCINDRHKAFSFVVKFKSATTLDYVLQTKRKFGILNYNDLFEITSDATINLYDMLPPTLYKLKCLAKDKARMNGYKYVWSRNGIVYVKKDECIEKVTIVTHNDLSKIN